MVFEDNFGGSHKTGIINKNFEFKEVEQLSDNTAYMLVYIKKSKINEICAGSDLNNINSQMI